MKKFWIIPVMLFMGHLLYAQVTQKDKELINVTDMLKIASVNNVEMNKTGNQVVFTVTTIEPGTENKFEYNYVNRIWMAGTGDEPALKQLTTQENASQPVFSPDGKQLAFVRNVENKPQVFLLSLEGGEAVQLTRFKYGAANPAWSPDGKQILFSASIPFMDLLKDSLLNPANTLPKWSLEKPGFENNEQLRKSDAQPDPDGTLDQIRAYLEKNVTDKKAKVLNKLNMQDETGVNPDLSFTHYFIIDVKKDAKPVQVTKGFYRYNYAAFTPDGRQLILGGDMDSTQHPDRSLEGQVYIMNTDGNNLRKLLGKEGVNYFSPRISPSGKWLAFQYANTSFVSVPALAVMSVNGTENNIIEIPFDRSKGNITWSSDEKYLYFISPGNGGAPIYRADIKERKAERLTDAESGTGSFDLKNNKLAFVKTRVADPFELYVSDGAGKNEKVITHFNTDWLQNRKLSFPEKRTFVNDKNETIEYWIMKPTGFVPDKKYPLLLEIHGGPSAMWGPGESTMWHEYQFFCSRGYGIVYCNPRGSGGYGIDFLRANINNWGDGPTSDVLTALDKTISAENWVDTSRLLITGGSYAGYLVAWIISHDHRFKAACAQRGVYDLSTFFGEGNAWRLVPDYFGGYPWDSTTKLKLDHESPITYVKDITTPLIIFHGENDRRTGVIQSEMLYRSLKVLNRPVEYVRHPNATHEITRSGDNRQRIDQMLRTYEFFERWIK